MFGRRTQTLGRQGVRFFLSGGVWVAFKLII